MKTYGLIGKKLGHSFSKKYFTEKFEKEGIANCQYELFELAQIEAFADLLKHKKRQLAGLNVTIPYKQEVIPFLDKLNPQAEKIGAVNVIKFEANGTLTGYNSDYIGFKSSLLTFLNGAKPPKALMLGTGGASKAVEVALADLGIEVQAVSRTAKNDILCYDDLSDELVQDHQLIINTTPLGMYPEVEKLPQLPYQSITADHFCYDLVYNPTETAFMKTCQQQGAKAVNGLEMLVGQAEAAWEIWRS